MCGGGGGGLQWPVSLPRTYFSWDMSAGGWRCPLVSESSADMLGHICGMGCAPLSGSLGHTYGHSGPGLLQTSPGT